MPAAPTWLFLLVRLLTVAGHAIMTPRNGLVPRIGSAGGLAPGQTGIELSPAGNARDIAKNTCGGAANQMGPGGTGGGTVQQPEIVKAPGEALVVQWEVTIAHDDAGAGGPPDLSGVRLALHYNTDDTFENNIMRGGIDGDPNFDQDLDNDGVPDLTIPAYNPPGNVPITVTRIINLPLGKVCAYCTVQFVWVLKNRDTFYMGCADFSIQERVDGAPPVLPDFASLKESPSVVAGREVAQGLDSTGGDNLSGGGGGGGGNAAAVACGVIFGLGVPLLLAFWAYTRHKAGKLNDDLQAIMNCDTAYCCGGGESGTPPPPGPTLQAGWTASIDPNSGKPYYVNSANGETTWVAPVAETQPTPAAPAAKANVSAVGAALPPGWTAATDPNSGATYYVNATTGATQWEMPSTTGTRC